MADRPDRHPRSFWLEEALGSERSEPAPELATDVNADVCIVGGGYTGLWTALQLKDAEPHLDIVLLERDISRFGVARRSFNGAKQHSSRLELHENGR